MAPCGCISLKRFPVGCISLKKGSLWHAYNLKRLPIGCIPLKMAPCAPHREPFSTYAPKKQSVSFLERKREKIAFFCFITNRDGHETNCGLSFHRFIGLRNCLQTNELTAPFRFVLVTNQSFWPLSNKFIPKRGVFPGHCGGQRSLWWLGKGSPSF